MRRKRIVLHDLSLIVHLNVGSHQSPAILCNTIFIYDSLFTIYYLRAYLSLLKLISKTSHVENSLIRENYD